MYVSKKKTIYEEVENEVECKSSNNIVKNLKLS